MILNHLFLNQERMDNVEGMYPNSGTLLAYENLPYMCHFLQGCRLFLIFLRCHTLINYIAKIKMDGEGMEGGGVCKENVVGNVVATLLHRPPLCVQLNKRI